MDGTTDRAAEQHRIAVEAVRALEGHDTRPGLVKPQNVFAMCGAAGPAGSCVHRVCTLREGHAGEHRGRGCVQCPTFLTWSDR